MLRCGKYKTDSKITVNSIANYLIIKEKIRINYPNLFYVLIHIQLVFRRLFCSIGISVVVDFVVSL